MRNGWKRHRTSCYRLLICLYNVDIIRAFLPFNYMSRFKTFSVINDSPQSDDVVLASSSSSSSTTTIAPASEKRIVLIRHGQTYMNEFIGGGGISFGEPGFTDVFEGAEEKSKYIDSPLSEFGRQQAQQLCDALRAGRELLENPSSPLSSTTENVSFLDDLDLVVVSPLTRALETLEIGLYEHVKDSNIPIVASPHASERVYLVSDLGKPTSALSARYPFVDFDTAFDEHPMLAGRKDSWHFTPTEELVKNYVEWRPHGEGQLYACFGEPQHVFDERMSELYHWLQSRKEKCIAVVCHAGVIEWMTQETFANCELRVVDFDTLTPRALKSNPATQTNELR